LSIFQGIGKLKSGELEIDISGINEAKIGEAEIGESKYSEFEFEKMKIDESIMGEDGIENDDICRTLLEKLTKMTYFDNISRNW